jgi:hypothetical protein
MDTRTVSTVVLICSLIFSGIAATGCTTKKLIVPQSAPRMWQVNPGDTVEIRLHDGRTVRIVVDRADEAGIVSRDNRAFQSTNIASVKHVRFSVGKTIGLALVAFVVFLGVAGAAAYAPYGPV